MTGADKVLQSPKADGINPASARQKDVRLTQGDLSRVPTWVWGIEEPVRGPDRVAEVSSGHSRPQAGEAIEAPQIRKEW